MLEDYPTDAELINLELRKADFDFVSKRIETKEDFLTNLESFSPDIILADYKMPKWTAIWFAVWSLFLVRLPAWNGWE